MYVSPFFNGRGRIEMKKVGRAFIPAITIFLVWMIMGWPNFTLAESKTNDRAKGNLDKFESSLNMGRAFASERLNLERGLRQNDRFPFPRRSFFINANLAIFVLQEATTSVETIFPAYGEEGSITQNIRTGSPLGLEINVGKYIPMGKIKFKTGIGMDSFPLKATGNFKLSVPHPYLYSSPRHYYFSEEFKNSSLHFYTFAYLVPLEIWRLQVSLGPIIGFSMGKYPGLEDFEIEDKSPFRWGDLEIKNKTYKSDSFSTFSFGGGLNIAFFLVENLAFQFSYKFQSLKPQIDLLKNKVNISFSRLFFCLEFAL